MTYYTVKGLVKRGLPILILTCFIAVLVGQILSAEEQILVKYPAILIMVPVLMKIGGDTGGMLGARLSSALHLGFSVSLRKSPVVRNSFIAAAIVGLISTIFACVIVWFIDIYSGRYIPFYTLFVVGIFVYTLNLFIVYLTTVVLSLASHKYGLDPDDTVIPLVASLGDLSGVVGIFIAIVVLSL